MSGQYASNRYVAINAGIFEHPLFVDQEFSEREAWLWLITKAAWRTHKIRTGGKMFELKRGQVIASRPFLAEQWGWGEKKVRLFLKLLLDEEMITKSKRKGRQATVLTVSNYEKFQSSAAVEGRHGAGNGADKGPIKGQQRGRPRATQYQGNTNVIPKESAARKNAPLKERKAKMAEDQIAFWAAYPKGRKGSKGAVLDLFEEIVTGKHKKRAKTSAATLIDGAKRYAACNPDPKYVKGPKAWLNDGCWDDDYGDQGLEKTDCKPDWWQSMAREQLQGLPVKFWKPLIDRHANGVWSEPMLGPLPGSADCIVPAALVADLNLIAKYGLMSGPGRQSEHMKEGKMCE